MRDIFVRKRRGGGGLFGQRPAVQEDSGDVRAAAGEPAEAAPSGKDENVTAVVLVPVVIVLGVVGAVAAVAGRLILAGLRRRT